MAPTTSSTPGWIAAALLVLASISIGLYVTKFGEPPALGVLNRALLDHSTLVAWWLTWMGFFVVLGPACIVLALVAWRVPAWRWRIGVSIGVLIIAWLGADACQHLFARSRPLYWVVKHETAFSYPSSHATIAVGFYGLWAELIRRSAWPRWARALGWAVLASLTLGICWSRLALGAHYASDVVGGILLGGGLAAAGLTLIRARDEGHCDSGPG